MIDDFTQNIKSRALASTLSTLHDRPRGRIIVLTGARQTGKTTLAKRLFKNHTYINLEDPVIRPEYGNIPAAEWSARYPETVIDEIQKLPGLIETIQAVYDQTPRTRYVLLGSSQILLIKKIRESLAGRVAIKTLWPLCLTEMVTESWEDAVSPSNLLSWIAHRDTGIFHCMPGEQTSFNRARPLWERFLKYGGMPALQHTGFTDEDCRFWLQDYHTTYLQRDLADLSQLDHLEPFVRAQRACALQTGRLVNFSDLARLVSIAPDTARRFVRYLELSYQVLMLEAFHRNPGKRLAKTPKLHFTDPGICRGITRSWGLTDGALFESAVVAEIHKQLHTAGIDASLYHLRTLDGREVDLLIELEDGFIGVECKLTDRTSSKDVRAFRNLERYLDKPLLLGLVVTGGNNNETWEDGKIYSVPAPWLLGPGTTLPS